MATIDLLSLVCKATLTVALLCTITLAQDVPECGSGSNPNGHSIDLREPDDPGPFHDLTVDELRRLRSFLESDPSIQASKSSEAQINSSYIFLADVFVPNKAEVLNYLDNNGAKPARQARVMMFRGDLSPPLVEEYLCGPLPDITCCELMVSDNRRNPVEFGFRPLNNVEYDYFDSNMLKVVDQEVGHILREAFGSDFTSCVRDPCITPNHIPVGSKFLGDKVRRMFVMTAYDLPYYTLHPLDFGFLANVDSTDVAEWFIEEVWYAGEVYESLDDLKQAHASGRTPTVNVTAPELNEDNLFSTLHRRGDYMPPNPQRPPTLVEPDGKRYSVKDGKVEYMGWTFNFRMSPYSGPALYDIRYKNERIAYEVALSDLAAFYSGYSPLLQTSDFMDAAALLGSNSKSLVPGGDCPDTATLINQTFLSHHSEEPAVYDSSFCLFEMNHGYPLRRHSSYSISEGSFYSGMLDSALILRSIMTIYNYDYIVDFIFHQNGAVEARLMSTGYIQSSAFSEAERTYGFRLKDSIIGNLHHHMAHFKVDLDVGGTSNRYETLDLLPDATVLNWRPSTKYSQTKFERSLKTTEQGALYHYNFDKPRYHVVHNDAHKTKHGELKGYRIQMNGMSKNLMPEDEGNEAIISWARYQMAVTRHKDGEFISSSNYGMFDSIDPTVDFSDFYADDEDIVDEDLVFWISAGMQHIPHTEDLPVTPTVGNHLSFFLLPYNYFEECPSMGSRDAMYIQHRNADVPELGVKVDRYGNSRDTCVMPKPSLERDVVENPDLVLETRREHSVD